MFSRVLSGWYHNNRLLKNRSDNSTTSLFDDKQRYFIPSKTISNTLSDYQRIIRNSFFKNWEEVLKSCVRVWLAESENKSLIDFTVLCAENEFKLACFVYDGRVLYIWDAFLWYIFWWTKKCHPGKHTIAEGWIAFLVRSYHKLVSAVWLEIDCWEVEPSLVASCVVIMGNEQIIRFSSVCFNSVINYTFINILVFPKCKIKITCFKFRPEVDIFKAL